MRKESLVGFAGQTRVLVSIDPSEPVIQLEGYYQGDEICFELDYQGSKRLIAHMLELLEVLKLNFDLEEDEDGREMDSEDAHEKRCSSQGNGCCRGKEDPCKETRRCC